MDTEPGRRPCRTCELVERRDRGEAPAWDSIVRTAGWDVVHAYGTSLPGWLCLVVRRHVAAVAELDPAEAAELGPLLQRVSHALAGAVGCAKTYVAQFAEHPDHAHVHFHVVPRPADLADDRRGPGIFAHLGVAPDQEVPEAERDQVALAVRRAMG